MTTTVYSDMTSVTFYFKTDPILQLYFHIDSGDF